VRLAPSTRAWAFATAALAVVAGGCASAPRRADQPVVKSLKIEGTAQVPEGEVKEKILTTQTSAWPWATPEYFDPNTFQADLRRIERFYEARGYYQARVVEEAVVPQGAGEVAIRVRVQEGAPTHVSEVRLEGLSALGPKEREFVLEDFPIARGEVFLEEEWSGLKDELRKRLNELGYAEAVVTGEVRVDVATLAAQVLLEFTPGPRYRFGEIFVATDPNPKVPPRWIIEQARAAIRKGAWYSESALAEAQARVFKMGVFGAVKVNRGAADREEGTVPVVVDVREAPFHTLRVGGGLGLDQTRNEIRALTEYVNRNFYGGLRTLSTRVRGGWAFIPNFWAVATQDRSSAPKSAPLFNLLTEFEQPRVFLPSLRYLTSLEGEFRPEQAYTLLGGQLKTGLSWQPHPDVVAQLSYNLEAYHFLSGQAVLGGRSPALAFGCPDPCMLSFIEQQVEWDRRNERAQPSSGYYLALTLQAGGGPLGGSFSYLRLSPDARYYFPVLPKDRLTVALRARLGTLLSAPGIESPIVARFYSGGSAMRGYNNRRLSPLLLVPAEGSRLGDGLAAPLGRQPGETVPIGGDGLFEGSVEARYRLSDKLLGALFMDTGFVTRPELNFGRVAEFFSEKMQYAVGTGIRYLTLVGPVRVDLAYRLPWGSPPPVYELGGTYLLAPPGGGCFGIGERQGGPTTSPEGRCTLHISIGEAF
jgi:translocation and assembly module TamA